MPKILNSKSYILIVIIIIAAFLRLYNITDLPPGLYHDEAMNGNNALEALSIGNFKVFYPENNGREGLFINIQAIFLKFLMPLSGGNPEPWMLRLVSALFGILTVLGVYFLTKELLANLLSQKIALLSAFLMATSFWHINFSRIGFRAIMAPFFLVWGLYFLLKSLNSILWMSDVHRTSDIPKLKIIFFSILAGIFYGLGFHTYIAYRATPLLILIIIGYWLLVNKDWQIRKKILLVAFLFSLIALIVFAPLGLYFLQNPQDFFGRTTQISIFSAEGGSASGGNSLSILKNLSINILKTAGMFNFIGDWNWRHNIAGRPELFWPVGILFIIGIILGIKSTLKKSDLPNINGNFRRSDFPKLPFLILFAWLIITALPVIISNEGLPHALRAILMAPAVFILAGFGGVWLYKFIKLKILILRTSDVLWTSDVQKLNQKLKGAKMKMLNIFVFIFLSLLVFEAYNTYFILWGQKTNVYGAFNADYVQIGRQLNNLPKKLPKYVVVEATGVDVRGIPMPAQTVMFITDTFSPEKQKEKNIYYVLPGQINKIPENSYVVILK